LSLIDGSLLIWLLPLVARANLLFERPKAFWIAPRKQAAAQAAEWSAVSAL
jgi:hypothetical protein